MKKLVDFSPPVKITNHGVILLLQVRKSLIHVEFEMIDSDNFFISKYSGIIYTDPQEEISMMGFYLLFHNEIRAVFYWGKIVSNLFPTSFPQENVSSSINLLYNPEFREFISVVCIQIQTFYGLYKKIVENQENHLILSMKVSLSLVS